MYRMHVGAVLQDSCGRVRPCQRPGSKDAGTRRLTVAGSPAGLVLLIVRALLHGRLLVPIYPLLVWSLSWAVLGELLSFHLEPLNPVPHIVHLCEQPRRLVDCGLHGGVKQKLI
jgi:hypothetical protein